MVDENVPLVTDGIVLEVTRKQLTTPRTFIGIAKEIGALYMGEAKEGYCIYMAGAEAEYGSIEDGFAIFELPSAEYLVCGFEAENFEELTNSAVYKAQTFMSHWMEKHKLTTTDFAGEMYYPATADCAYMEHWMLPVKIK